MPDQPRRQNGRVWIDGVPPLLWDTGRNCTFAGALVAATAPTEHPLTYSEIMGRSALAFRVRWSNDDTATSWCPSNVIGEMPDEIAAVRQLLGWHLVVREQFGDREPDVEEIREQVVASIYMGRPVMAYTSRYDTAVIYGYENGGRAFRVREYGSEETPSTIAVADVGPLQIYLGEYEKPPSDRDATARALELAVSNWRRERHDGGVEGREYWYGEAAFEAWVGDIEEAGDRSPEHAEIIRSLSMHNRAALVDARAAASEFLHSVETTLGRASTTDLHEVARLYQEEVHLLKSTTTRAWSAEDIQKWSPDVRRAEVAALRSAMQIESDAAGVLSRVISADGVAA